MADLTTLYVQAPALLDAGERGLSTDAMPGIPALERQPPPIPMGPGRAERRECEYLRRGTLTLIAKCDVARGQVVAPSMGPTRTAEDFLVRIPRTVASDPEATRWHFVTANLNPHQSESLVRFVAQYDGITDNLGPKEQHGILRSMATRAAFLSDPTHHSVFHSTPKHASWMHQIAMWFSIVVRKVLKRASFTAVEDVQAQVLAFIDYCNATMAKPFQWTYGRKPLSV